MAITKRVLTPTTTNKTALVEAINKLREQKQNSNNQTKTVINQPQGTKPNTNTQFQSISAPSYAKLSNNKSYNDFLNNEIRKKAESNIPLLKPTPEKQSLYDQWQNYYKSEVIRKALSGEQLARPNEWKMSIYNQYTKEQAPDFTYDNRPTLSFDEAANRARQQLDPLYQRALENILAQKYQNELNAGEIAAKRGLSHSGLAADQLTKIAIASQGQIASVEAEKAARIAELAQAMVERDQDRAFRERQQAFQEFLGNADLDYRYDQFNYGKHRDAEMDRRYWDERAYQRERDKVGDSRWKQEFDYRKYLDQLQDKRAQEALAWEKAKFKTEDAWRRYVYNNMSAAEKAQLEWAKRQFGEEMAWRMFELKYNGELAKSQAQAELDYYKNFTGDEKGGGSNYYKSKQASKSPTFKTFQAHMSQAVKMGVPVSWVPALTELIGRESSWNPKAKNPKSTAHGYGQFLKSTRAAYEKKTGLDYDNPVHQIVMMAQYVKDRYGTPEKALAWWDTHKWY
jgi:hypothetical protein